MQESDVRYRVLIVDDAPTVREALRWVLEEGLDVTVVGEAGEGRTGRATGNRVTDQTWSFWILNCPISMVTPSPV